MKEQRGAAREVKWSNERAAHRCTERAHPVASHQAAVAPAAPAVASESKCCAAAYLSFVSVNSTCRCTRGSYLQERMQLGGQISWQISWPFASPAMDVHACMLVLQNQQRRSMASTAAQRGPNWLT